MLVLMAIPARVACEILMNLFNITRSLPHQTNEEAAQQCSRWSIVTVRLISTVYCLHFAERGCRSNILFLHVRFVENLHFIRLVHKFTPFSAFLDQHCGHIENAF